jgi:hypothetical protein
MQRTLAVLLSAGLSLAPLRASYAQNPQPAPPGVTNPPVAPPSAPMPPPEKLAPGAEGIAGMQTFSDKLAQQNGTLRPPETGGGTVIKPGPGAGTMPVIPTPGTPGAIKR